MKKYFFIGMCLSIFLQAFTQNNVQTASVPNIGWTINLPQNADDFTKDLLNKINESAQSIKEIALEKASSPDYKGEILAIANINVTQSESTNPSFSIWIKYDRLNPAAFVNTGWKSVFYHMVDDDMHLQQGASQIMPDIDTTTSFETIGNSFFAIFKRETKYKEARLQALNSTIYRFYTMRDGNRLLSIQLYFKDNEKGRDALDLIRNSSFTKIVSSSGVMPFTSIKDNFTGELEKYAFEPKSSGNANDVNDYDKLFTSTEINASFAGTKKDWLQYLHCCLDQSALVKDKVSGRRSVKVKFVLRRDGQPYDLKAIDFPEDCPDCAIEALKLFYKHTQPGAPDDCKVVISKEPYKQWQPAISSNTNVNSYVTVVIPFGYDDDPANEKIINENYKQNLKPQKQIKSNNDGWVVAPPVLQNDGNSTKTNDEDDDEDDVQRASVIEKGGKYVLTLLKDHSTHVVFRPIPKNGDSAYYSNYNKSIPLNQGAWGEITTDKNGKKIVKLFEFEGDDNKVTITDIPLEYFENTFYKHK